MAKYRAKRGNYPFDITKEDIEVPESCPVLGIPLFVTDGKFSENSPTIDKIIPSLGYVKGNVEVISHRANQLKQDGTIEELELILKYMKEKT